MAVTASRGTAALDSILKSITGIACAVLDYTKAPPGVVPCFEILQRSASLVCMLSSLPGSLEPAAVQELLVSTTGKITYVPAAVIITPAQGKRWALNKPAVPFAAYTDMPPKATGGEMLLRGFSSEEKCYRR